MIYARYKDKRDLKKCVVTPLLDHYEQDWLAVEKGDDSVSVVHMLVCV